MSRHRRPSRVLPVLLAVLAACGSDSTGPPGTTSPDTLDIFGDPGIAGDGDLASVVDEVRAFYDLPAMAAVLVREGVVVESVAVGVRALGYPEVVTIDDHWRIGSMTKAFTATLAAILVEDGLITWDSTVGSVLTGVTSIAPQWLDVRLEELVSHTSGLQRDNSLMFDGVSREAFAEDALLTAPEGTRGIFHYSNTAFVIAGLMLEEVTDQSWETLIQEEILEPLGMTSTGFGPPVWSDIDRSHPLGYDSGSLGGIWTPHTPEVGFATYGPAGSIRTTIADYVLWMNEQIAGANGTGTLLPPAGYQRLHAPVMGTNNSEYWWLAPARYALGWFVSGSRETLQFGGDAVFHTGTLYGFRAQVWLVPQRQLAIAVFTNGRRDSGERDGILLHSHQATYRVIEALLARHDAAYP